MAMNVKYREVFEYPDGVHKGKIDRVERRTAPFEYLDIFVQPEDTDFAVKYGVPASLSKRSKLGNLMRTFGVKLSSLKQGEEFDVEKVLVGKNVQFQTAIDKDGFIKILDNSIKPLS